MIADRNKVCDRLRSCDRDRRRSQKIEPVLSKGWFPYDRGSQIADRNKVCDRLRSYGNYFCDRLRSCDRDRRRSQKIEPCSISCDRLRSICDCLRCDLRSYGNQPLDRTWFYLLRCDHDRRIADDRRPYCDLRSYGNQP